MKKLHRIKALKGLESVSLVTNNDIKDVTKWVLDRLGTTMLDYSFNKVLFQMSLKMNEMQRLFRPFIL